MIPTTPTRSTKSSAERRLFSLLVEADLPTPNWCFHSLNLAEHEYKLVGELDFVLLCPLGLLVLEVKGGRVECRDGVWVFTDRYNVEHRRNESPFAQAKSGMFSLRERLSAELGRSPVKDVPFGFAVVFPDCELDVHSVEWSQEMVIDKRSLASAPIETHLGELLRYWQRKNGISSDSRGEVLQPIARLLRPDFDLVLDLRSRLNVLDERMQRLTNEQYERLDAFESTPRILCLGGAGTGKTFIAAEMARRHAASGQRVLVTCASEVLAAYLRARLALPRIDVVPMARLAAGVSPEEPYDVLVLDEAQDVLNLDDLCALDRYVDGGLECGIWRIFCDVNNQSAIAGRYDPEALEYLKRLGGAVGELNRNCRNTHEIVLQTKLLTGADLGTASAGHGMPVEIHFYTDADDELQQLEKHLARLAEDGVPVDEITLLSPLPFDQSVASRLQRRWKRRLRCVDPDLAGAWPVHDLTFATVDAFKGLENRFICLLDIHDLEDEPAALSVLYVAMSRARAALWVAMSCSVESTVKELCMRNLPLVTADLEPSNG